ncbi:MAG TPA: hypothetical protein VNN20_11065 [Thermodesulfobacteriota bacterium]|nr:hypothetical protein [Thermodesulfobacteriota bacterium]
MADITGDEPLSNQNLNPKYYTSDTIILRSTDKLNLYFQRLIWFD